MNIRIGNAAWPVKMPEYEALQGSFKGVQRVLDTATATTSADRPTTWSATAVEQLTEEWALKAEQALQLTARRRSGQ